MQSAAGWVLVTGSTAGIGQALVARLAAEGCSVIAAARDPAGVRVPNGPGRVEAVRLDFDEPATIEAAARDAARIVGVAGLAGLVNMATSAIAPKYGLCVAPSHLHISRPHQFGVFRHVDLHDQRF